MSQEKSLKKPFKGKFSLEAKDQNEKADPTFIISYHKSSKIESFPQLFSFECHLIAWEYQFPLKETKLPMTSECL